VFSKVLISKNYLILDLFKKITVCSAIDNSRYIENLERKLNDKYFCE